MLQTKLAIELITAQYFGSSADVGSVLLYCRVDLQTADLQSVSNLQIICDLLKKQKQNHIKF